MLAMWKKDVSSYIFTLSSAERKQSYYPGRATKSLSIILFAGIFWRWEVYWHHLNNFFFTSTFALFTGRQSCDLSRNKHLVLCVLTWHYSVLADNQTDCLLFRPNDYVCYKWAFFFLIIFHPVVLPGFLLHPSTKSRKGILKVNHPTLAEDDSQSHGMWQKYILIWITFDLSSFVLGI